MGWLTLMGMALVPLGVILLILGSQVRDQPRPGDQIYLLQHLLPIPDEPATRFYQRLYRALRDSLAERVASGSGRPIDIVLVGMGFGPHRLFARRSLFAERPLYLLIRYEHLKYYVYAAQSPVGLYLSVWGYSDYHAGEGEGQRFIGKSRGWKYFQNQTLFQYDATHMFNASVSELVREVVEGYHAEAGLRPLEAMECRPRLHAFYESPFPQAAQTTAVPLTAAPIVATPSVWPSSPPPFSVPSMSASHSAAMSNQASPDSLRSAGNASENMEKEVDSSVHNTEPFSLAPSHLDENSEHTFSRPSPSALFDMNAVEEDSEESQMEGSRAEAAHAEAAHAEAEESP